MTYASTADLIRRFGEAEIIQLSDHEVTGEVNEAVVAAALADTDELINGYVGGRYAIPLAPVPPLVVMLACDLARWRLTRDTPTATVEAGHKHAMALLEDISRGKVTLHAAGVTPPEAPAATDSDSPRLVGPGRQFLNGGLKGF